MKELIINIKKAMFEARNSHDYLMNFYSFLKLSLKMNTRLI